MTLASAGRPVPLPEPGGVPAAADTPRVEPASGWDRPLRVHLSVIIVALLAATSLPLMWLTYAQGTKSALDSAEQQMRLLGQQTIHLYESVSGDGYSIVSMGSVLPSLTAPPAEFLDAKKEFFLKAMKGSAHVDGVYVGYPDGSFVQGVNVASNVKWSAAISAPAGTTFALRVIQRQPDDGATSVWRFLDAEGNVVAERSPEASTYDSRRRPWYRAAAATAEPVAVGPYVSASTNQLTLSVAARMTRQASTVIGADVLLETISHLLAEQAVSARSVGYVFDDEDRLIVHSDPALMQKIADNLSAPRGQAQPIDDAVLDVVRGFLGRAGSDDDRTLRFDVGGEPYLARFSTEGFSRLLAGSTIVVAAPLTDFTGASTRLLMQTMSVAAFLVGAGILTALFVARRISRALVELSDDARRIGDLNFAGRPRTHSWISEINMLATALGAARTAIRTFALYVPRELVRRIIASGQSAVAQAVRQDVTILFTDIRDFTTISERQTPEAIVDMLSGYFERFNAIVERHNGVIVQYLGDSVYAMWNAPIPDETHVDNGCRCTLALKAAVEELNEEARSAGKPELVTRFGLHTGPAVVGSVGAQSRRQYTAMGDTVNVASRLEGLNKQFGSTILASAAVKERCSAGFQFRPLGATQAKGREAEIEVFELVGD